MSKIFLHCSPPAFISLPSPSLSILKAFLVANGYDSKVIYWNLMFHDIQKKFLLKKSNLSTDRDPLLLFINYIAFENNDTYLLKRIETILKTNAPDYLITEPGLYREHMLFYKQEVDRLLDKVFINLNLSDSLYFGFTLKFEQWVFASMLALKLKQTFPSIPIVVGGINSPEASESFLFNFHQFDIAIWGEGEYSLLALTKQFESNNSDFNQVPRVAFRENGKITISDKKGMYVDLSSKNLIPDYLDYFQDKEFYPIYDYALSIEISRGCHWNKCHFCYLNTGYKYRRKTAEKIKYEILSLIDKYNTFKFSTTDNDLIGADIDYFSQLLDVFIDIRKKHPQFLIVVAEIITKGLSRSIIKKMADAGLMNIQIGYESSSNNLLTKIQKCNTFASNTLFFKFAHLYKIHITGLNVIYNLFEETDEDIIEAIKNLRFLRFYRAHFGLNHHLTPLTINSSSRYYKKYDGEINKNQWQPVNTTAFHLQKYWTEGTGWHVLDYAKFERNSLWQYFEILDKHYLGHRYRYSIKTTNGHIEYTEFRDTKQIANMVLGKESVEYFILKSCNNEVISFDSLLNILNIDKDTLLGNLNTFFEQGIIYYNDDLSEIISVINIE